MLNVNRDHNEELMKDCRDLKDYAEYVDRVRRYTKKMDHQENGPGRGCRAGDH